MKLSPQPAIALPTLHRYLLRLASSHQLLTHTIRRDPTPLSIDGVEYLAAPTNLLVTDPQTLTTVSLSPVLTHLSDTTTHYLYCQRSDGSQRLLPARGISSSFPTLFDESGSPS